MRPIASMAATIFAVFALSSASVAEEPVSYEIVDHGIPKSLTGQPGDPASGKEVMVDRKLGNCLACHQVSALNDQPFHGEVGPPLDGAGERWEEPQLRLIVTNSKAMFPDTIMPAFHSVENLNRVTGKFEGKTILSAQQVEDVVAFLKTLKN